ncbi:FtsX-like permease family protein [Streptomyces glaucosporus]|uniref:FtsX-like permease family protein n=1 Tax=Streptomyces glaucosporus TaxID=284044 RepID=A0ABN3IG45_9ACTN
MAATERPGTERPEAARTARDGASRAQAGTGVPWVRVRLRASAGTALAMGLLVMVTAFLAAAVPRQITAQEDAALREAVARAPLEQRSVTVAGAVRPRAALMTDRTTPLRTRMEEFAQDLWDIARPPLAPDRDETVYGIRLGSPVTVTGRGLPRPEPQRMNPRLTLVTQPRNTEEHMRLLSGRLPSPDVRDGTVEAAITARTAETMNLGVGSTVRLQGFTGARLTVRVSGVVAPRDRDAAHWRAETDLLEPSLRSVPNAAPPQPQYWHFTALIDGEAREVMRCCEGGAVAYWHHPVRTDALSAADVPALRSALAALTGGADETELLGRSPVADSDTYADGLIELLDAFEEERRTSRSLVLTAVAGVGAAAVVVLVMAGVLTAAARRPELELLRARGGSLPGMGLRLLGETAAVAVPPAAAGTACALWWVPAPRSAVPVALGAAVAALGEVALPVLAAAAHRRPRPRAREDVAAARPSRRRAVLELTVAVLAAGGLAAVWRRGDGGAAAGPDPLAVAAPVLPAVVAALVLLRLYPLPLRMLARPASRLRGLVLPLALARLGRAPAVSLLPLLAVLVALTVSAFGGSVLAGVADGRARAALAEVGADARVEAPDGLPGGLEERIRRTAGVREVTAARIEHGRNLEGNLSRPFTLIAVDPRSYARLAERTGLGDGPFPAGALARAREGEPLPAVVSPGLAAVLDKGDVATVGADRGPVPVRVVAVRGGTPAAMGEFAVVPALGPAAAHPPERGGGALPPTTLLVSGSGIDGRALRDEARRAGDGIAVTLRSEREAGYESGPLQDGTARIHGAAVIAGAGYGALALLLWLTQTAPGRRALLTRLRTMGASRRQARALVWAETLPPTVLGVLGGAATALVTAALLRPGVDLAPLAFTARTRAVVGEEVRVALEPDAASLLWPSLLLLALACGTAVVQARAGGAGAEGNRLRTGERD